MDPVSLQVFGEQELVEHLARGGAHHSHCISIRNPDETIPAIIKDSFRSILELRFYDAEQSEARVPEPRDVKGVIEFFRMTATEATGYTIHCGQGISRAPAIALGLLFLLTGSEDEAAYHLKRIRPGARPHRRLVRFFDEQLGCRLAQANERLREQGTPPGGLLTRAQGMRTR